MSWGIQLLNIARRIATSGTFRGKIVRVFNRFVLRKRCGIRTKLTRLNQHLNPDGLPE